ncbi:MAG: hypothetical protein AB1638_11955, partial [Nitrospirota bacterium]
MASIEEKIDFFCSYFADQAKVIGALAVDEAQAEGTDQERHQIRFYQKALLITHIDTLAGIRYTEKRYPQLNKRNKERFIQFLEVSEAWPEGQLVSIPFLEGYIKNGKIGAGRLKNHITEKLAANYKKGSFNIKASIIDDPYDFLLGLSSTEQEEKAINENRHYELLYRYRNYLVHESREPGNAMEVAPENEAYYHGYIGEDRLFLAYPLGLFQQIFARSLEYVRTY